MIKRSFLVTGLALFIAAFGWSSHGQPAPTTGQSTGQIAAAAEKFLATLDDAQRGKVVFDFKDDAQRKRWSNLPSPMFQRQGLRMGDLTQTQRDAAMAVLSAALSPAGYEKVLQIVQADEILKNGPTGAAGAAACLGPTSITSRFLANLPRPSRGRSNSAGIILA